MGRGRRTSSRRAIGVSLIVSLGVGAVFGALLVLTTVQEPLLPRLLSAPFLGEVATIGLLASVLVSVPAGILGGVFAGAMVRRHQALSRGQWLRRGAAAGCGIGAGTCLLYGVAMTGLEFSGDAAVVVLFYVVAGAFCGALCGAIMGRWCATESE